MCDKKANFLVIMKPYWDKEKPVCDEHSMMLKTVCAAAGQEVIFNEIKTSQLCCFK